MPFRNDSIMLQNMSLAFDSEHMNNLSIDKKVKQSKTIKSRNDNPYRKDMSLSKDFEMTISKQDDFDDPEDQVNFRDDTFIQQPVDFNDSQVAPMEQRKYLSYIG